MFTLQLNSNLKLISDVFFFFFCLVIHIKKEIWPPSDCLQFWGNPQKKMWCQTHYTVFKMLHRLACVHLKLCNQKLLNNYLMCLFGLVLTFNLASGRFLWCSIYFWSSSKALEVQTNSSIGPTILLLIGSDTKVSRYVGIGWNVTLPFKLWLLWNILYFVQYHLWKKTCFG